MKRLIYILTILVVSVTAAAAQGRTFNFENNTIQAFKPWKESDAKIRELELPDNKYALEVSGGTYFAMHAIDAGTEYKLTCDTKFLWGKEAPGIMVAGYNPDTKKLEILERFTLPMDKKFTTSTFTFTSKYKGYMRITFHPYMKSGGRFLLDNVSYEPIKK